MVFRGLNDYHKNITKLVSDYEEYENIGGKSHEDASQDNENDSKVKVHKDEINELKKQIKGLINTEFNIGIILIITTQI